MDQSLKNPDILNTSQERVKRGWVLVPEKPTKEMLEIMRIGYNHDSLDDGNAPINCMSCCYKAMVKAAKSVETTEYTGEYCPCGGEIYIRDGKSVCEACGR